MTIRTHSKREKQRESMGTEAVPEEPSSTIPKLPLFSVPPAKSPDRSGQLTPPLYTLASVPFRWEDEPGKPRFATTATLAIDFSHKSLELPPRLLLMEAKAAKLPSPTTTLDGPYMGRPKILSSSFRMMMSREYYYGEINSSENGELGSMVLRKTEVKESSVFGSWRRRSLNVKREVGGGGGGSIFPSYSMDRDDDGIAQRRSSRAKNGRIKRTGSFSSLSQARPHFWATVYHGLKQVVPWRKRKLNKEVSRE